MIYRIWCEVSGGVTGHRTAWLKGDDDTVFETDDENAARAEADRLNREMNRGNGARFSYTVKRRVQR